MAKILGIYLLCIALGFTVAALLAYGLYGLGFGVMPILPIGVPV